MCKKCNVLKELFKAAKSNPQYRYSPTLEFIKEMIKEEKIELFAGDCILEETDKHLNEEIHFTVCHYLRCKSCSQYFFIGSCIRGTPIYKILDNLNNENFDKLLWGHCGTLYEQNKYSLTEILRNILKW